MVHPPPKTKPGSVSLFHVCDVLFPQVRISLTKTDHFQLSSPGDQNLCVCGNEAKSVKYVITPVQLGHIPLKVTVQNVVPSLCGDPSKETPLGISETVTRMLLVEVHAFVRHFELWQTRGNLKKSGSL